MFRCLLLVVLLILPGYSCRNSGAQTNSDGPSTTLNSNQSTNSSTQNGRALANGIWGGQGISLEINDSGAEINYDCAHGSINGKIVPDRVGKFVAKGSHVPEHGGAVREDENRSGQPVTYQGSIDGETMTLTVTLSDTKETIG